MNSSGPRTEPWGTPNLRVLTVDTSPLNWTDCLRSIKHEQNQSRAVDLSAAFDNVDQDILIERLSRSYGIRSTALNWFCSYLIDRRQSVQFNGDVSTVRTLMFGVPQASVFGPLLFILYTTYLGKLMDSCGLSSHFYADDSQLYAAGKICKFS